MKPLNQWFRQGAIAVIVPLAIAGFPSLASPAVAGDFYYQQTNLVSDGFVPAANIDPNLKNPWGISLSQTGPFWISNQVTGTSTLYNGNGQPFPLASPLVVTIPQNSTPPAGPTGQVFNNTPDFLLSSGGKSGKGLFFFANLDGSISGWNPSGTPTQAVQVVPASSSAIYTGLALGASGSDNFLYAANVLTGKIDVFDKNYNPATLAGNFSDPSVPSGLVPFNIENLGGKLYVTYAPPQDADEAPLGTGAVSIFDTDGNLLQHLIDGSQPDGSQIASPWGLALAPSDFGQFGNALLVGNFNDTNAFINAFDPVSGKFFGTLRDGKGDPINNPYLWDLTFGNGGNGGAKNELFFTAGLGDEQHGLFGKLEAKPVPEPATISLFSLGLIPALALLRRRKS
jgi:uncharacterized protein (TIGR03118 family)